LRTPYVWITRVVAAVGSAANAADLITMTRSQDVVVQRQPVSRAITRLADQELGYLVLHDTGVSPRVYRAHLTCTMDESFVQTYFPTTQYIATCPRARLTCR
jgi:hypothetical protein